jgi:outer membrane protein
MFETGNNWNKKLTGPKKSGTLVFLVIAAFALLLAGCISKQEFYQQVSKSRDDAYQKWKNRNETPEQFQPRIDGQLSIEDCLKLALANNKSLQNIVLEKEVARGNELKSYSAILPTVNLTGSYTRPDRLNSSSGVPIGSLNNYSIGLSVTQPIFAGGSIKAKIHSGKLFSLLTDQTVRSATADLIYSAEHSYYDVLLNQHLYQISVDAVRSAQAHLDDVRRKQQVGVALKFDVLRAEVELSNSKADLIQNKNAINLSRAQLLDVMGVSQDSNVMLSDSLTYVPLKMTMEDAVDVAYHNRPDLFASQFNLEYQKQLLAIAQSRFWPTISASYNNTLANPDPHNSTNINWGRS